MISTEGRYWSTGITVRYGYAGSDTYGWAARLNYFDDGFADDDPDARAVSTEGALKTRYMVRDGDKVSGLSLAIDVLHTDAARLGIVFRQDAMLFYAHDGEDLDNPPPDGWRAALGAEAARLGWGFY